MDEKLIIELDNDKIKYGVFKTNENLDYKLLTNKISSNPRSIVSSERKGITR